METIVIISLALDAIFLGVAIKSKATTLICFISCLMLVGVIKYIHMVFK